jgi:hypothetical protein
VKQTPVSTHPFASGLRRCGTSHEGSFLAERFCQVEAGFKPASWVSSPTVGLSRPVSVGSPNTSRSQIKLDSPDWAANRPAPVDAREKEEHVP